MENDLKYPLFFIDVSSKRITFFTTHVFMLTQNIIRHMFSKVILEENLAIDSNLML